MSSEFILPAWFNRFVSKRTKEDMEKRANLTGTARQTRSYWFGLIEIEVKTTDLSHGAEK